MYNVLNCLFLKSILKNYLQNTILFSTLKYFIKLFCKSIFKIVFKTILFSVFKILFKTILPITAKRDKSRRAYQSINQSGLRLLITPLTRTQMGLHEREYKHAGMVNPLQQSDCR